MKNLLVLGVVVALAACGGGGDGGGSSAPVAATQAFNLKTTYANYLQTPRTRNFSLAGIANGAAVTGSGTGTVGALQPSTFEGASALVSTAVITGTIVSNGQSRPYGGSIRDYYDSNLNLLGVSSVQYSVVGSSTVLPTAAKVNDTGLLMTLTNYPTSAKAYITGTSTLAYSLTADTETSAILHLVSTQKNTSGTTLSTNTTKYRVTTTNTATQLSEDYVEPAMSLTLTFD